MPGWLISIIISLVLKIGIPALLDFLRKKFPRIPMSNVLHILADHAEKVADVKADTKGLVKECLGVGCPVETVNGNK